MGLWLFVGHNICSTWLPLREPVCACMYVCIVSQFSLTLTLREAEEAAGIPSACTEHFDCSEEDVTESTLSTL